MKNYTCITLFILLIAGCSAFESTYTPKNIKATPLWSDSGIMWGQDKEKISANITSVNIECIPIKSDKNSKTYYEIAATAEVSYAVLDKKFYRNATIFSQLQANIIFEAVSSTGVVLRQEKSPVRIIESGSHTTSSVKFTDISIEEIKKIVKVQARWEYGK